MIILFIFGAIFHNNLITVIYLTLSVFFYGLYLIYDTQLLIGNKYFDIGIDDYIIASIVLYIDIVLLFIKLLRLIGIIK